MAVSGTRENIDTRVGVLENGLRDLRGVVDTGRVETRQGFQDVNSAIIRLSEQISTRAAPTNWWGVFSAAAATVVVIGALFSLAEWRVGVASDPSHRAQELARKQIEKLHEQVIELRIQNGIAADRMGRAAVPR